VKTIEACPGCGGTPSGRWPAITAPFIASYALRAPVVPCALLECGACGLRYFDARYEPAELERLYAGYRGMEYFQARHRHEPWYLRRHNLGAGHDPRVVAERKAATTAILTPHVNPASLRRVLDYGGDTGQFIPDGIGQERDVYEVSDAVPVPGVRRLSEDRQLQQGHYHLVLLNHVLEHVVDPLALLRRVVDLLTPGTGLLHVEVPLERYRLAGAGQGPSASARVAWLVQHPSVLKLVDLYSTVGRLGLGAIPPLGILKAHEHLNLFHAPSLEAACRAAGLQVLSTVPGARGGMQVVSTLARRPPGR
jgi:hypothetical protein